ncbi:hypothetical protein NDN08_002053 [Rhodosorus marinus]|uniref:Uncharacterized protein n=1 Tax=Rhodosorus marinus TaxID=101924 RepID=A0AAV8UYF6_9RHOD|nr:hypothetical protein NDN08_002053 [Rhodosorus marinus]
MKTVKLITLLVAVITMTAYVEAENYQPASYWMTGFTVVSWRMYLFDEPVPNNCMPLIGKANAWGAENPWVKVADVCISIVTYQGELSTLFHYTARPGYTIAAAYSGVHRNCLQKKKFPYQTVAKFGELGEQVVTQIVPFSEYDCPAEYEEGCCNRRNCLSPKVRAHKVLAPEYTFTGFPPNGKYGCRTVRGLRRCLADLQCFNPE